MTCWNYRVRRVKYDNDEYGYNIVEAHYNSHSDCEDNKQSGYTKDAIDPYSDDLNGLRWVLERMLEALDSPVIEEE